MARLMAILVAAGLGLGQAALAENSALDKAMQKDPARFAQRMTDLIAGFAGTGGLRLEGIEEHIALERAAARASALRRLHAMDLDADGAVTRAELGVSQRAANAATRGRMERQFVSADADRNGQIDAGELAAEGKAAALQALGEAEAGMLRALLSLDADGNGALTVTELEDAVARIGDVT